MEKKIKTIIEAHSINPRELTIGAEFRKYDMDSVIREIKPYYKQVSNNSSVLTYRGYNELNTLLFEYLASSVNVHYFF